MENRARLRGPKTTVKKRSGRKPLLKKFADYLTSETFMYAPFVSPQPYNSPSSSKVVELKKPQKEKQLFMEQVVEYLKSDDYMYAPLLDLPHSPPEPLQHCEMIRMDVSTRRSSMEVNQRTDLLQNVNQQSENRLPQQDTPDQHTRDPKETVKHTVYQICRSTSVSRNVTLNSPLRAHG